MCHGILVKFVGWLSTVSKRNSPEPLYSPTGYPILIWLSRQMLWIMCLPWFYPSILLMEKFTPSHFTCTLSIPPSWTMMLTIKNYWPSLKPSNTGVNIWKAVQFLLMWLQITKPGIFHHNKAAYSLPAEYLSQFNMVIHLHPRKLGVKPDALTRCWDVYCKGGNSNFATANLSNFCTIFIDKQLNALLQATYFATPILCITVIMDIEQLHNTIQESYPLDTVTSQETFWRILRTIWNHCKTWYTFVYPMVTQAYAHYIPSLPYFPTGTKNS